MVAGGLSLFALVRSIVFILAHMVLVSASFSLVSLVEMRGIAGVGQYLQGKISCTRSSAYPTQFVAFIQLHV